MADVEEVIKLLGAVHKTSPFGYMFATPDEARNALARMGMIAEKQGQFGLDTSETDESLGLFTGLNEAGLLYTGLESDTDGTVANLSDIYETMDIRGVAGHYFLKPLARAIDGFLAGSKRGKDRAEDHINKVKEAYKIVFDEEEGGGIQKGVPEEYIPKEHEKLGGREGVPEYILIHEGTRLGGIPEGYAILPTGIVDDLRKDSAKYKGIWPKILQLSQDYNSKITELSNDSAETTHSTTELKNYQSQLIRTMKELDLT